MPDSLCDLTATAAAKSLQLCPTLWDLIDGSLLGSVTMGFFRQEHWIGSPFPPPGNLPDPGIESESPALQADSSPSEPPGKPFSIS